MQLNWLKKKRKLDAKKRDKQHSRYSKRRRLNPSTASHLITNSELGGASKPHETFVQKYSRMLEEQKRKEEEARLRAEKEMSEIQGQKEKVEIDSNPMSLPLQGTNVSPKKMAAINLKPPPIKQDEDGKDIEDDPQRIEFWNNVRMTLRSRLPFQCLQNLLRPPIDLRFGKEGESMGKSPKLFNVKYGVEWTDTVAIDCEMVGVRRRGDALARVSIVNFDGECMYDAFVKPKGDDSCKTVTDYRTWVSGVEEEDLLKYGKSYEVVQKEVIRMLRGRTIVGHSLNNDFKVLDCTQVLHQHWNNMDKDTLKQLKQQSKETKKSLRELKRRWISKRGKWYFDTAKCPLLHDNIQRPRGLKYCLELFLGVHIQDDEHDSVIDAMSAMMLYRSVLPEIKALRRETKRKWHELKTAGDEEGLRQFRKENMFSLKTMSKRERMKYEKQRTQREMKRKKEMEGKRAEENRKKMYAYHPRLDQLIAAGSKYTRGDGEGEEREKEKDGRTCLLCGQWGHSSAECKADAKQFGKYENVPISNV